ncbi:hypothetical protein [Sphaerisporangium aureirubrum]|uniref:DUF4439 domain-containing protein n=1 Tax=Sphaerisporangium aureirubrum TaxID=1544736 RepID=A0ABW1NNA0_9ACTN
MRQRALTRRAVLRGTAAGAAVVAAAGCSAPPPAPPKPAPPDPETVLLTKVIAAKEEMIALYRRAAASGGDRAAELQPFQRRHEAHLAELRRRLPPRPSPAASSPAPSLSPSPSPSTQGARVPVSRLRQLEREAAATRPRQIDGVSPSLAQLLSCIGACEAAHAVALARVS